MTHFPAWLHRKLPAGGKIEATRQILGRYGLNTICASALCPNQGECLAAGTATFLILGDRCARGCAFCAVTSGLPGAPDPEEPGRLARAAAALNLRHVVVTSVTRDDLPDGGADHFVNVIKELRLLLPAASIEVLTPDFGGRKQSVDAVIAAGPDVYNHNIETVQRLYPAVRPGAAYERSLGLLRRVKDRAPQIYTKSGLMVGLGEEPDEVEAAMKDLRRAGCDLLTIGQYLRPSPRHIPVARFVTPEEFASFKERALLLGFIHVESGPYVRSSYHAHRLFDQAAPPHPGAGEHQVSGG